MEEYISQNKKAWEYDAYRFWIEQSGTPASRAEKILKDPAAALKKYQQYFDSFENLRIANICGSCGKKAVPLALLGADVTVFDISEDNKRYACETARAAGTHINYVIGDVLEIDMFEYGDFFDLVFMEGGILHYFHDIDKFMYTMYSLLKPGGRMICSDFHPFRKIYDVLEFGQPSMSYFSTDITAGEMAHARFYPKEIRENFPLCSYRKYNLSEILNAIISSHFIILRFDEHPAWTNEDLPGEFTVIARKQQTDS